MSTREAFEKWLSTEFGIDIREIVSRRNVDVEGWLGYGDPASSESPEATWNAMFVAWQAATEQGAGEAGYSVEADLEETQRALSAAEAKIEEYEGFFTGEDGDNQDGDAREIIRDYLRAHPPKPTGGGVPDEWKLVPIKPTGKMLAYAFSESSVGGKSDYRQIWAAMLNATQQPPEQD